MKMYKIYNPATKLYSAGGLKNTWSKNGKTWTAAGLKEHISYVYTMHLRYNNSAMFNQYQSCEVHEFESDPIILDIKQFIGVN